MATIFLAAVLGGWLVGSSAAEAAKKTPRRPRQKVVKTDQSQPAAAPGGQSSSLTPAPPPADLPAQETNTKVLNATPIEAAPPEATIKEAAPNKASVDAARADPPPEETIFLIWDITPLGIEASTAVLLRDLLSLELEKVLGKRLMRAPVELDGNVRRQVDECGRTAECVAQAGGAMGAHRVIVGVASTLGEAYNVNLKVIDTATGEVMAKAQATVTGDRDRMLQVMQEVVFHLLDPRLLRGSLQVHIAMVGVSVYVDGELAGTTPLPGPVERLLAGEHTLKLTSPSMKDHFSFFTIFPGKTTDVRVDPEQIAALQAEIEAAGEMMRVPIYKRWWFWTIVAGVAVAAAGGTAMALTAGGGDSGQPATSLGTIDLTAK